MAFFTETKESHEFASICSFMNIFGDDLHLKLSHSQISTCLQTTDSGSVPKYWFDIHKMLLTKIKVRSRGEEFIKVLNRFVKSNISSDYGDYFILSPLQKAMVLNRIFDYQFDKNIKFKEIINGKNSKNLRINNFGIDIFGCIYWLFIDSEKDIIMYKENLEENSFKIKAESINDLRTLLEELKITEMEHDNLSNLYTLKSDDQLICNPNEDYASKEIYISERSEIKTEINDTSNMYHKALSPEHSNDSDNVNDVIQLQNISRSKEEPFCHLIEDDVSRKIDIVVKNTTNQTLKLKQSNLMGLESILNRCNADTNLNNNKIILTTKADLLNKMVDSHLKAAKIEIIEIEDSEIDEEKSQQKQFKIKSKEVVNVIEINDSESESKNVKFNKKKRVKKINSIKKHEDVLKNVKHFRKILPSFESRKMNYKVIKSAGNEVIEIEDSDVENQVTSYIKKDEETKINIDKAKNVNKQLSVKCNKNKNKTSVKQWRQTKSSEESNDEYSEEYSEQSEASSIPDVEYVDNDRPESDFDFDTLNVVEDMVECKSSLRIKERLIKIAESAIACEICLSQSFPEMILLCNNCRLGHHSTCLKPPVMVIPCDEWFCSKCHHKKLIKKLSNKIEQLMKSLTKSEKMKKRNFENIFFDDDSTAKLNDERNTSENGIQNPNIVHWRRKSKRNHLHCVSYKEEAEVSSSNDDDESNKVSKPFYKNKLRPAHVLQSINSRITRNSNIKRHFSEIESDGCTTDLDNDVPSGSRMIGFIKNNFHCKVLKENIEEDSLDNNETPSQKSPPEDVQFIDKEKLTDQYKKKTDCTEYNLVDVNLFIEKLKLKEGVIEIENVKYIVNEDEYMNISSEDQGIKSRINTQSVSKSLFR